MGSEGIGTRGRCVGEVHVHVGRGGEVLGESRAFLDVPPGGLYLKSYRLASSKAGPPPPQPDGKKSAGGGPPLRRG